ncbi:MAG: response regulator, partial [Candidatus Hydrothermarchaeota archaeon]
GFSDRNAHFLALTVKVELEKIKSRRPQTRVIIYTGYGSAKDVVEAIRKGAADFLTKPFSASELKVGVKKALENGRD